MRILMDTGGLARTGGAEDSCRPTGHHAVAMLTSTERKSSPMEANVSNRWLWAPRASRAPTLLQRSPTESNSTPYLPQPLSARACGIIVKQGLGPRPVRARAV